MNGPKNITREELYERIWKIPATKLAKELGISDVALWLRSFSKTTAIA
jgi:hypothetical protein